MAIPVKQTIFEDNVVILHQDSDDINIQPLRFNSIEDLNAHILSLVETGEVGLPINASTVDLAAIVSR